MEIEWGTLVCVTHEGKKIKCIKHAFDYVEKRSWLSLDMNSAIVFDRVCHFEWNKLGIPHF